LQNFGFLVEAGSGNWETSSGISSTNSGNWGSSISSGNWGGSISSTNSGNGGGSDAMGNMALDNRGTSSIADMLKGPLDTNGLVGDSVDWGVDGGGDLLDGVGLGLVDQGLGDLLDGPHGSSEGLASIGGDVLEDGLGDMGGLDDGGGLVGGDGGRDVGVGGLGHGVGDGGDLGAHLSESMGLGGGVGKVATESVVLDGSRVMGRGPHQEGGGGNTHGSGTAKSDQGGEKQEGVHCGSC